MNLTQDPAVDLSEAVPLQLGGRDWLVAPTMLRQNRRIFPHLPAAVDLLNRVDGVFRQIRAEKIAADSDPAKKLEIGGDDRLLQRLNVSDAEVGAAVAIIAGALSRVYPKLTPDDIDNLPIPVLDLVPALRIVLAATGATEAKKEGPPSPGEGPATPTSP